MTPQERIAELEAEVAWLRSELAIVVDIEAIGRVADRLQVSPAQGAILWTLYKRAGRPLTPDQLAEYAVVPQCHEERTTNTVRTIVCKLRRRLGPGVVETVLGAYRLSPRGLALVAAAIDQALLQERAA